MTKTNTLTEGVIDSTKYRGYQSNNLWIQGSPIKDYFTVSSKDYNEIAIPFDFYVIGFYLMQSELPSVELSVQLKIIDPKNNFTVLTYTATNVNDPTAYITDETKQNVIIPSGFKIKFVLVSPTTMQGLEILAIIDRIKLTPL